MARVEEWRFPKNMVSIIVVIVVLDDGNLTTYGAARYRVHAFHVVLFCFKPAAHYIQPINKFNFSLMFFAPA
jgi:hypothetical protein